MSPRRGEEEGVRGAPEGVGVGTLAGGEPGRGAGSEVRPPVATRDAADLETEGRREEEARRPGLAREAASRVTDTPVARSPSPRHTSCVWTSVRLVHGATADPGPVAVSTQSGAVADGPLAVEGPVKGDDTTATGPGNRGSGDGETLRVSPRGSRREIKVEISTEVEDTPRLPGPRPRRLLKLTDVNTNVNPEIEDGVAPLPPVLRTVTDAGAVEDVGAPRRGAVSGRVGGLTVVCVSEPRDGASGPTPSILSFALRGQVCRRRSVIEFEGPLP